MDNLEIINLWKQYDEKLEKSLSFNRQVLGLLQQQKAKSALRPVRNYKWLSVIIGLAYVALLVYLIVYTHTFSSVFFKISIGVHLLVSVLAIGMYVQQLTLINQIDNSENIVQMQHKLAGLQASTLKVIAICWLQLPIFSTWNITVKMIEETPISFWFIQVPVVALFTFAGIWLYKNINIVNQDKKWFKLMFSGKEWTGILNAGRFLREIDHFEKV